MSFQTMQSNVSRRDRIVEALDLIEKSAASQRADKAEVQALLEPVLAKLGELGFYCSPNIPGETPQAAVSAPSASEDVGPPSTGRTAPPSPERMAVARASWKIDRSMKLIAEHLDTLKEMGEATRAYARSAGIEIPEDPRPDAPFDIGEGR